MRHDEPAMSWLPVKLVQLARHGERESESVSVMLWVIAQKWRFMRLLVHSFFSCRCFGNNNGADVIHFRVGLC